MISRIKRRINTIPKLVYWLSFFGVSVLIIIYNDDIAGELMLAYFLLFVLLMIWWVIKQAKYIINLKNEKMKTELLHLKSQVNPHFFFNTLNNLYGSMEKDSKAREMVLKLSDMMRYSIYEGQKDRVTLGEELDYLKNYIALQEARYHKKTDIQFNHKIDDTSSKIMPLLFIILLENAFKHGLENLEENAYIHVNLTASEKQLHFEIENNFETQEASDVKGIGLKNLKRRLELAYPNKHFLSFKIDTNVYNVKLTLELI